MKFFNTVSKMALTTTLGAALAFTGGCDKEELEKTKDQLVKVSSERDQLKGQITTMQASMDSMKKDLDDAKAQAAKCATPAPAGEPVAPPPEPAKAPAKGKTSSKSSSSAPTVAPVAPKIDNSAPAGTEKNPIKTGGGPAGGL